ncbi:MAG: DUF3365 domain-containing protein [Cyclobacteriaceae bacterium]
MLRTVLSTTFLVLLILNFGCSSSNSGKNTSGEASQKDLKLMKTNCYSCHGPSDTPAGRMAPSMFAIKKNYALASESREDFIEQIASFMSDPSADKSNMPDAVRQYGVMPKMNFPDDQVRKIAAYVFDNEIEKPKWHDAHVPEETVGANSPSDSAGYLKKGMEYALSTKQVLGKNLMGAINARGSAGAVEFCNVKALPLTDSMARVQNVSIRRVSDKARNPENQASGKELEFIKESKRQLADGGKIVPKIVESGDQVVGFYPISTNAMCLQCHGDPKTDIAESTLAKIQSKYPDDRAIGYGENELRGIWVVTIPK